MDFIVDNYFWFVVAAIAVLMIIIGYIAEKTDFGRKPFKEKKIENNGLNSETAELANSTEEPVIIPEEDGLNDSVVVSDVNVDELPDDMNESDITDEQIEEIGEEQIIDEESTDTAKNVTEESMVEPDIPEIISDNEENVSNEVEEVIADDSEDDVWKF